MYLDKSGKFVRTDLWREGKWLDLWSVVHFLSGITMGFSPRYLGLNTFSAYIIVFLILVSYEMFEALAKIKETQSNRVMDVVVGMISFAIMYYIHPLIPEPGGTYLLATFFVLTSMLSFIGWQASQKAAGFEAKLREEIIRSRERIKTSFRERKIRRRLKKMKQKALREQKEVQDN